MKKLKDLWPVIVPLVGVIAVFIGGLCLFVEYSEVGWLPEDGILGMGAAYSPFLGFATSSTLYWFGVTAVGLLLARWPMEWLSRWKRDVPPHAVAYVRTDLKLLWSFPVWVVGLIAVAVALISLRLEFLDIVVRYGPVAAVQGVFGAVLLSTYHRVQFGRTGIILPNIDERTAARYAREHRRGGYAFLALWIVAPFLLGKNLGALIDAGLKIAQLRKDHATVHVAAPWDRPLATSGLQKQESFLGPTYARFGNVTVHMRSVGSRVILEIPSEDEGSRFINIPRQFVEIE